MSDDLYIGPTALSPGPPPDRSAKLASAILIPLLIFFVLVILVFYVFFTTAQVDGPSMLPTLKDGDRLLLTHGEESPSRGNIVVTVVPEGNQSVEVVKRVIGVPGDSVEIRGDIAIVNGQPEPDYGQIVVPEYAEWLPAITVPPGTVYVMGDNRPVSLDSRREGPVPIAGIKGRAVAIFAPVNRIGAVH